MPKSKKPTDQKGESPKALEKLLELVRSEVRRRLGPDASYEERRDKAAEVMSEVLRRDEERDLKDAVSEAEEIEVEGKRYRKLEQCRDGYIETLTLNMLH